MLAAAGGGPEGDDRGGEDVIRWSSVTAKPEWKRNAAPTDALDFQLVDILQAGDADFDILACDAAGASAHVRVNGFHPYILVRPSIDMTEYLATFENLLSNHHEVRRRAGHATVDGARRVVATLERKRSFQGYEAADSQFVRVTCASPSLVQPLRGALDGGLLIDGRRVGFELFEAGVPYPLRFMIDKGMYGCGWFSLASAAAITPYASTCDRAFMVHERDVTAHAVEGRWAAIAPLRILSYDIECCAAVGFPVPERDPVIQIAAIVERLGAPADTDGVVRSEFAVVFVLHGAAPFPDAEVRNFRTEEDLLTAFSNFVSTVDADVVTGYNIVNFDFTYLLDRAKHLGLRTFAHMSRLRGSPVYYNRDEDNRSKWGYMVNLRAPGWMMHDILQYMHAAGKKLRSYKLNAVAKLFLNDEKEDVAPSEIAPLHHGTPQTRRRLATYCWKDARLPLQLNSKCMCLIQFVEQARASGVPFNYLYTRGQQVKVFSLMLRYGRQRGLHAPWHDSAAVEKTEKYEGAIVLDPIVGYYTVPIVTLDFNSLYPSIMRYWNMSHETLVDLARYPEMADRVCVNANGSAFIRPEFGVGVMPTLLQDLLARRKAVKAMMKPMDPSIFEYMILDGRQEQLKLVCNSAYGFNGVAHGLLPCLAIAESVTERGREMIMRTKALIESAFTVANGYAFDAVVLYGDTDSVMIKFGVPDRATAFELGAAAAAMVNRMFPNPAGLESLPAVVNIEPEKVYHPYLLLQKKRYAGLKYMKADDKRPSVDSKGIEAKRRDNCGLLRRAMDRCLAYILIERRPEAAVAFVKDIVARLLQRRIDLSELVITVGVKGAYKKPETMVGHVLRQKLAKRDPASAPRDGDRMPYVVTSGMKGAKRTERAEDPIEVLRADRPIDTGYYLNNQLREPLTRLLKVFVRDPNELFEGDHTRRVVVPSSRGPLAGFVAVGAKCPGCGVSVPEGAVTCRACVPRQADLYVRAVTRLRDVEEEHHAAWTHCQRCQGSNLEPVLCSNRECTIFYKREHVRGDLERADRAVKRFRAAEIDDW